MDVCLTTENHEKRTHAFVEQMKIDAARVVDSLAYGMKFWRVIDRRALGLPLNLTRTPVACHRIARLAAGLRAPRQPPARLPA